MDLVLLGHQDASRHEAAGEANNEFSGTLSDLKESVKFFVRGENYDTPTRQITLVPPPMFIELKRDEDHPAYLYHKAAILRGEESAR